ncbi:hypothetical protein FQN60_012215 [Etheostoma spectabile]|uniref:Transmembrane protein 186 n=1 Tax=Etheostoma spectabile TaxID=54343 RepID=A0A5J5DPB8_9PERO|nr:hypothetical protein FQN60_012215 [Etheostoma spectabile]
MIYNLPHIKLLRALSRIKLLQTAITVVILPPVYLLYFQGDIPFFLVSYTTGIALFAGVMLYTASHFFRRVVGMMYLDPSQTTLKVSHLTFWGRRQDIYMPVSDVMTIGDTGDSVNETIVKLKRYSCPETFYFSINFGRVVDKQGFEKFKTEMKVNSFASLMGFRDGSLDLGTINPGGCGGLQRVCLTLHQKPIEASMQDWFSHPTNREKPCRPRCTFEFLESDASPSRGFLLKKETRLSLGLHTGWREEECSAPNIMPSVFPVPFLIQFHIAADRREQPGPSSDSRNYYVGHIEKGRESNGTRERDSSSSRFSGLCRSVSVAEWTVPVFVPVPVSRCHPEARRHCFRNDRRRSGLLPYSLALSFPMTSLPSRGRGAGRVQEARLQTELVTPKPIRDAGDSRFSRKHRAEGLVAVLGKTRFGGEVLVLQAVQTGGQALNSAEKTASFHSTLRLRRHQQPLRKSHLKDILKMITNHPWASMEVCGGARGPQMHPSNSNWEKKREREREIEEEGGGMEFLRRAGGGSHHGGRREALTRHRSTAAMVAGNVFGTFTAALWDNTATCIARGVKVKADGGQEDSERKGDKLKTPDGGITSGELYPPIEVSVRWFPDGREL